MKTTKSAKALVMRPLFRQQKEKPKKGKGAYQRRQKHRKAGFDRPFFCLLFTD